MLKGPLPMSLIPMESHLAIMDGVSLRQSKAEDRLTLAMPAIDLLSYYDSRLLADAITVSEGLLLTLNIPLASQQTVFTLFEAKLIPMPFPDDPQTALTWNIEAPCLALSENKLESSVLSEEQFEQSRFVEVPNLLRRLPNADRTPFLHCNIVFFLVLLML